MEQTQFIGTLVVAAASLIAVMTPIIKLNGSIVKLNTTLDCILKEDKARDEQIKANEQKIELLNRLGDKHEIRISNLEDKN